MPPAIASVELARISDRHLFDDRRPRRAGRVAQQLRQHLAGDRLRPLRLDQLQQLFASGLALGRIGLRARVGENQALYIARGEAQHRERDVAAHRQPANHRLLHVEGVEQIDDLPGIVVHRRRRRIGGAAVEAAQLRDNPVPAGIGERELPFPHPRVERKGVEQHERAVRPLAGAGRGFEIAQSSDVGHAPV